MFPDLKRLCALPGVEWGGEGSAWNDLFDPTGLILHLPPTHGGYWCSPTDAVAIELDLEQPQGLC